MASADFSWLPSGITEVKVGRTVTDAAKARRGEGGLSKVPREFYTVHYRDMPISVDEHGSGTVEYTPSEAGGQNTITINRGSVGVFAGAEVETTDEQCVLIIDTESGEVILEKVDSMFRLALAKKNYAPLRTSQSLPQALSSKDRAPSTKEPPKASVIPEEEEEGEISENEPLVKAKPPPVSRTAPPKANAPIASRATATATSAPSKAATSAPPKATASAPSKVTPSAPSKAAASASSKPKVANGAIGQKSGPKARPIVRKRTPPPEPAPAPINLPGGAWKDSSGAVLDREAPAPPKRLRPSPPPIPGPSRAPPHPPVPSAPTAPRAAPAAPSVPTLPVPSVKPISTASAASSEDSDMVEVDTGSANPPPSAPVPSFPPPPRFLGTFVEVDADMMSPASAQHQQDLFSPVEGSQTGFGTQDADGDDDDFLQDAMGDDDDMEEVAPEEPAPDDEVAAEDDQDDFLAEMMVDGPDDYTQPDVDSDSDSDDD